MIKTTKKRKMRENKAVSWWKSEALSLQGKKEAPDSGSFRK
jgi:hypothetical protein